MKPLTSGTDFRPKLSAMPSGYFRLTLSFRDVEELLAERGIDVSYETIRMWTLKFGPQITASLKLSRPAP